MTHANRAITGFHQDELGDWVAELECGHNQHVRHNPPWQWREWVLEAETRNARLGSLLPCPLCDRGEPPARAGDNSEGGDPACWSGLVCPECGGIAGDGPGHHPGCTAST